MREFRKIEKKWQKNWEENGIYKTEQSSKKKKFYALVEFPYPSGEGLHVGHAKGQTAVDVYSRFKRMQGFNVLNPMGYDAFGLPAENFAIKNQKPPASFTQRNIKNFIRQQKSFGSSFDWSRKVDTTDPEYYKWTQWIFLQLFKAGLAYEKEAPINWCPSCKTGLANEEVIDGKCERCDTSVEKKNMKQWFLKITAYADKLIKDLDDVDWPEYIKTSQKNWIGRSEGVNLEFKIKDSEYRINVFTTRVDTIFGCTYCVIAPEHKLIESLGNKIENLGEVKRYLDKIKDKSDLQRTELNKDKTGVELKGIRAINPFNNEEIPVFAADYVLGSYGTGAVMAVPAHDERDSEFAKKYDLKIRTSISPEAGETDKDALFTEDGFLVNSGKYTGLSSVDARKKMAEWLVGEKIGKKQVNYKLRDWLFSRQRYWGEPIPIIKCPHCGNVPLKEKDLPLLLPKVKNYKPTGTGESPLAAVKSWVNVKCPRCGCPAKRETNTMPQWAGSSWYFLRYCDPHNKKEFASEKALKYFMPVDIYFGGAEHTTVHLLYSRFWTKALHDMGFVPVKEPFYRRVQHGLILGPDNRKMSKRWGNIIDPLDVIKKYGADVMRTYIMFMGPYGDYAAWSVSCIEGVQRFLNKVWKIGDKPISKGESGSEAVLLLNRTTAKVTEDIGKVSYHTAIAKLMTMANYLFPREEIEKNVWENYLKLLAPFAPHITEELWQKLRTRKSASKFFKSIHKESWPKYDKDLVKEETVEIAVQINGKMRGRFSAPAGISAEEVEKTALADPKIKNYVGYGKPKKIIFVQDRIINFVL